MEEREKIMNKGSKKEKKMQKARGVGVTKLASNCYNSIERKDFAKFVTTLQTIKCKQSVHHT